MTIKQVINLDCRVEDNNEIIQKYLKKIKPLSKYKDMEDVPLYKIEKAVTVLSKKYNMRVRELVPDVRSNDKETIWRSILINDNDLKQVGVIFGLSLYEVLAKVVIYMYSIRSSVGERR